MVFLYVEQVFSTDKANRAHACGGCRAHPIGRVFNNKTSLWADANILGGMFEQIWRGFAAQNLFCTKDVFEFVSAADCRQGCANPIERATGRNAILLPQAVKLVDQVDYAIYGSQF